MDLYRINLNLLVALDQLLQYVSVTLAAERLSLTQSAMSNNLKQLREVFNDPLLVRHGQHMVLTVLAKELRPKLRQVLQHVQDLVQASQKFDPSIATRSFTVAINEHLVQALLPKLSDYLAIHAPKIVVNLIPQVFCGSEAPFDAGEYDIGLARAFNIEPRVRSKLLMTGSPVCLMNEKHPLAAKKKITMDDYLEYEHVGFKVGPTSPLIVDYALARLGVARKIRITTSSLRIMLHAIAHSDRLLGVVYDKTIVASNRLPCVTKPLPFSVEDVGFFMFWHEREEQDLGHKWLRDILVKILTEKK